MNQMILPWLPKPTIEWLNEFLKEPKKIFEFGSGNSTIYLDGKTEKLVSVEHEQKWYEKTKPSLKKAEYFLIHPNDYPTYITKYPKKYFDLVIIDGLQREECIKHSIAHIKKGGFLLLDDSQRERYNKIKKKLEKYPSEEFKENEHETIIWRI